ncbi:MAG: cbb3-type cytochrome c oxidase subunit 3, partial [Bergeyella zoohelcum]|nr:cbb3-type cytochrome c oxidase subunit 3 [Bergeyella zoohelcum]
MIPQNFKDILSNEAYAGLLNTISLLIFVIFFVGLVMYVFSRPKKHYTDVANAPLDD